MKPDEYCAVCGRTPREHTGSHHEDDGLPNGPHWPASKTRQWLDLVQEVWTSGPAGKLNVITVCVLFPLGLIVIALATWFGAR